MHSRIDVISGVFATGKIKFIFTDDRAISRFLDLLHSKRQILHKLNKSYSKFRTVKKMSPPNDNSNVCACDVIGLRKITRLEV